MCKRIIIGEKNEVLGTHHAKERPHKDRKANMCVCRVALPVLGPGGLRIVAALSGPAGF